jgi:hypothetical protein
MCYARYEVSAKVLLCPAQVPHGLSWNLNRLSEKFRVGQLLSGTYEHKLNKEIQILMLW